MIRSVCIHGHFYQPPRDNPWLEAVELQDSAYPYHDWNERITAECYAANGAARTLDASGHIARITNNYSRISFNFGPTLLAWLEHNAIETYRRVLAADEESRARFSGHGNAFAQAYNHMILPLANARDRLTQVRWGLADFRHRFRREPEGMWLPETAVDLATLDVLAAHGVRFTVLAPHQARRYRTAGERSWHEAPHGAIDPTRPYLVNLPSGRSITVFFYDGPISRAVAFERLLERGENLCNRLLGAFSPARTHPQLVHVATDGETYGHHHRFGDMALAWALECLERAGVRLTNYGEHLERVPPSHEAEIEEMTSWSCAHGVGRWRSDCGCATGGRAGWNQRWRAPLRTALDALRDALAARFERLGGDLLTDHWSARDAYIDVVLDRSPERVDRFLATWSRCEPAARDEVTTLKLLEMQRNMMLAFTSCGWFFDDVAGIETVQVLAYAARALQLARELFPDAAELEPGFLTALESARSNEPEKGSARDIYEREVRPAVVGLETVAAHVALGSLFDGLERNARVYCYQVRRDESHLQEAGRLRLALGRMTVRSVITRESLRASFGLLHFGDHNVSAGVSRLDDEAHLAMASEAAEAFQSSDLPRVIRALDTHFGGLSFSLASLFRDEQRRVIERILGTTLSEAEAEYAQLFDHHAPLLHFLARLSVPLPRAFSTAAELVLNARLRRALEASQPDAERVRSLLRQVREYQVALDEPGLAFAARRTLARLMDALVAEPGNVDAVRSLIGAVGLTRTLPFDVDLWRLQNRYWELQAGPPAGVGKDWHESVGILGELLDVRPGS